MEKTPEREGKFHFIGPLGENVSSFYALRESDISVPDLEAAKKLFETLLNYTRVLVPGFQLIVTEHANFADSWFQDALVEEPWMNPPALVPQDWPSWSK